MVQYRCMNFLGVKGRINARETRLTGRAIMHTRSRTFYTPVPSHGTISQANP
jgi:hypothetical protein